MFDFDDFEKDEDFYKSVSFDESTEMGDFPSTMMMVTNALKSVDFDSTLKGGHHLMMKIFNMTGLEATEDSEQVLNVVMSLISHLFALLLTCEDRESYFNYFDQTVVYPMMNTGGMNG